MRNISLWEVLRHTVLGASLIVPSRLKHEPCRCLYAKYVRFQVIYYTYSLKSYLKSHRASGLSISTHIHGRAVGLRTPTT